MDFIDKKENLAKTIEEYSLDKSKESELMSLVREYSDDSDFKGKELFMNIFNEFEKFVSELSSKELKQRVLMIRSYMD